MSSEIIQGVAYDNYDDFQHVNFIFPQIFISLFWDYCKPKVLEKSDVFFLTQGRALSYHQRIY